MGKGAIVVPAEKVAKAAKMQRLQKFGLALQPNQLLTTESVYLLRQRFQSSIYFRWNAAQDMEKYLGGRNYCKRASLAFGDEKLRLFLGKTVKVNIDSRGI